jgi:Putative Ig domain
MNIFCPSPPNTCLDPTIPTANFSSEAPDEDVFFGRGYNYGLVPPLGSAWQSTGCIGTCASIVSQEDADLCAMRQLIECFSIVWPIETPTAPGDPPLTGAARFSPRIVFDNEAQTCDFTCPDGQIFSVTVPSGTVNEFSVAAANAIALSIACNHAVATRICIGDLTPATGCMGTVYSGECVILGPVRTGLYSVTIVSGDLPPGLIMVLTDTGITFVGTPIVAGESSPMTIQVEDPDGNSMQKTITFKFVEISPSTLTSGNENQAYSQALSTNLGDPMEQTWSVVSGALPAGMTLSEAGLLSGTPTESGDFTFTVRVVDTSL